MRPRYETAADRKRELAVAEKVGKHFNCFVKKMPDFYPLDYAFIRDNRVDWFAEIKCRDHARGEYSTIMLSLQKYAAAIRLGQASGLPVNLVVKWTDAIGLLHLPFPGAVTRWGGRNDRGDWQDMEPCVHFPVEDFMEIKL